MLGRLTLILALAAGIATVAVAALAIVALAPEARRATPSPPAIVLPTPPPSPTPALASASPGGSPSGSPGRSPVNALHVGEPAPQLHVVRVGGGTIDLAALRGKPVWVNFTGTYCPPCRDEFPVMNGFQARYASAGLVVVAVDVNEDEATIASFAKELNVTFPIGLDPDGSVSQAWGAFVLPVHYWIDAQGIVRDGAYGGIGADIMAQALTKILPGVTVSP
jgi:cytochrome c biogenesis protein CcmG, thiol:disulfide interchange protein DsbE